GVTTTYGLTSPLQSTHATSHTFALSDLTPGTTYDYRVQVTDMDDNITYSENRTFVTAAIVEMPSQVATPTSAPVPPEATASLSVTSSDMTSATLTSNAATPSS